MKLLKLLTRAGRQELVREAALEYLTPDKVAELAAEGVAKALEAGAERMSDERIAQIAKGCDMGADALKHITSAVNPEGEEGKIVSASEKVLIATDIRAALTNLVTDAAIADAIEKAVVLVP